MKWDAATALEFTEKNEENRIVDMEASLIKTIWDEIEESVALGSYQAKVALDFRHMFRPEIAYKAVENYLDVLRSHGYVTSMTKSEYNKSYIVIVEW